MTPEDLRDVIASAFPYRKKQLHPKDCGCNDCVLINRITTAVLSAENAPQADLMAGFEQLDKAMDSTNAAKSKAPAWVRTAVATVKAACEKHPDAHVALIIRYQSQGETKRNVVCLTNASGPSAFADLMEAVLDPMLGKASDGDEDAKPEIKH